MNKEEYPESIFAYEFFYRVGLCESKGEAKRVISQGGCYLGERENRTRIPSPNFEITLDHFDENNLLRIWKGKKKTLLLQAKEEKEECE